MPKLFNIFVLFIFLVTASSALAKGKPVTAQLPATAPADADVKKVFGQLAQLLTKFPRDRDGNLIGKTIHVGRKCEIVDMHSNSSYVSIQMDIGQGISLFSADCPNGCSTVIGGVPVGVIEASANASDISLMFMEYFGGGFDNPTVGFGLDTLSVHQASDTEAEVTLGFTKAYPTPPTKVEETYSCIFEW